MRLHRATRFAPAPGPVLTVVMDGFALSDSREGNAVRLARTPTLDRLMAERPWTALRAHGTAVGMPSDRDMGNSEVGHNAMGAGRVFAQGAALVDHAIADGSIWHGEGWSDIAATARDGTLHLLGLFSDGNVHSHIDHLRVLVARARADGLPRVRIHALLDGRDVGDHTAHEYLASFEAFLEAHRSDDFDVAIASGGGRMAVTMDRYGADWEIVERGWRLHVHGEGRRFASAREAITAFRDEQPGISDQYLPGFVVARDGEPVGPVRDGDAVVNFNFRGDRAIEISRAFTEDDFGRFDRAPRPLVTYAGMMEYDGDQHLPPRYLVEPPAIDRTLGEYLARSGVTQYAVAETHKFGHVTYFWNGNRSGKFDDELETYEEVPSLRQPFEAQPAMQAAAVTDALIAALESGRYRCLRCNYANGDMVGHTGVLAATIAAVEAVDAQLARLLPVVARLNGTTIITADHGNADEMYLTGHDGNVLRDAHGAPKPKTAHSLNPVPCILIGPEGAGWRLRDDLAEPGLGSLAATTLNLLGYEAPEDYDASLIEPC